MKNLENYGVQEMNYKEVETIEGGGPIADLVHWYTNLSWVKKLEYAPGYVHSQYGI